MRGRHGHSSTGFADARHRQERATLVMKLADGARPSIGDVMERDPLTWQRLLDLYAPNDYLPLDASVALEETIRRHVPETLQADFTRWTDSHTAEVVMVQTAAFDVGVALGLMMMRGGVR